MRDREALKPLQKYDKTLHSSFTLSLVELRDLDFNRYLAKQIQTLPCLAWD